MKSFFSIARLRAARAPVKYGLSLLAGAAAALAFAPYYLLPLMFIAFPLLLLLAENSRGWRRASVLGWFFGFGHFMVGFQWIGNAFQVDAKTFGWAEYPALVLLSGAMAFYPAVALGVSKALWGRLSSRGVKPFNLPGLLIFAIAWSVTEWLRGHLFTGFPWNLIGYVWGFSAPMLQPAALFGIYGLSLLTAILVAMPALWFGYPINTRRGLKGLMGMAGLMLAMLAFGLLSLGLADHGPYANSGKAPGVQLRLVQANIAEKDKWNAEIRRANLDLYMGLSARPAVVPPTTILWPETAVSYFLGSDPTASAFISAALPDPDGQVITGAPRMDETGGDGLKLWNSLFVIGQGGRVLADYDKFHLVPFGEYLPFRPLMAAIGLDKLAPGEVDFSAGAGPQTLRVAGLPPFSPLICYEIIFPGEVVKSTDNPGGRPQWILNITNDAWFGESMGPYQHLVAARTRAIEEGLPVIRIAGTGISAIIDAEGRVLASLPLNFSGIIDGQLPLPRTIRPLYARSGDWSYLFLLSISIIGVISRRNVRETIRP